MLISQTCKFVIHRMQFLQMLNQISTLNNNSSENRLMYVYPGTEPCLEDV